jgi:hypothetical protein
MLRPCASRCWPRPWSGGATLGHAQSATVGADGSAKGSVNAPTVATGGGTAQGAASGSGTAAMPGTSGAMQDKR